MSTILITGANRGIGLALAHLYHQNGWSVYGTYRNQPPQDFPGTAFELDVTDNAAIAALGARMAGINLDIMWNNAGVYLDREDE